jgi:hypothetical protein
MQFPVPLFHDLFRRELPMADHPDLRTDSDLLILSPDSKGVSAFVSWVESSEQSGEWK